MNNEKNISRQQISEYFKKFDTKGDGSKLCFHDFYEFLKYQSNQNNNSKGIEISVARFFFNGAVDSDPLWITPSEYEYLQNSLDSSDPVEFAKLVFRGMDKNRVGTIGMEEIQDTQVIFVPNEQNRVSQLLLKAEHEIEGTGQRMNYARFIEVTTGEVIEAGFDPYNDKYPKSKCCIIL